jgi:hypothetical protein
MKIFLRGFLLSFSPPMIMHRLPFPLTTFQQYITQYVESFR